MSREHHAAYASRKSPANRTSDEDGNMLFMRQWAGALAAVRRVSCCPLQAAVVEIPAIVCLSSKASRRCSEGTHRSIPWLQADTAEKKAAPKRQRKGGQRPSGGRKQHSPPGEQAAEASADFPPFQQFGPPAPLEDRFRRALCCLHGHLSAPADIDNSILAVQPAVLTPVIILGSARSPYICALDMVAGAAALFRRCWPALRT